MLTEAEDNVDKDISATMDKVSHMKNRLSDKLKADEEEWKSKNQLKGKLPGNNPEKKGLTIELPEKKKEIESFKKDLKSITDLEKKLKTDLEKKKSEEKSGEKQGVDKEKEGALPTLPDLPSAI